MNHIWGDNGYCRACGCSDMSWAADEVCKGDTAKYEAEERAYKEWKENAE